MRILKAIVDAHINHGEPVGSKYISQDAMITCSSATIRNEMAELTEMGYLAQPHTSAGRVPTELGYRFYVDSLSRQYTATKSEIEEINERLKYKLTEMDEILEAASRLAASFTDYTGIAFKSGSGQVRISKFDSVYLSQRDFLVVMLFKGDIVKTKPIHLSFSITKEDLMKFTEALNIYLANTASDGITMPIIVKLESIMGAAGAMVHPTIMGVLEEKERLLDVISSREASEDGINVYIGRDGDDAMRDTTLIYKNVNVGGKKLAIGVIGPKRMNYSRVIGMINQLALAIDNTFGALPEGNEDPKGN